MFIEGTTRQSQIAIPLKFELLRSYIKGIDYDWLRHSDKRRIDNQLFEDNLPKVRAKLKVISYKTSQNLLIKNVKHYRDSDSENFIVMKVNAGLTEERARELLDKKTGKFLEDSSYKEYKLENVPLKVVKSLHFLKDIFQKFELPLPDKMTLTYLDDNYTKLEGHEFIKLLLKVRNLKEGKEWEDFEEFCLKHTTKKGKVVEHGFECNLSSPNQKAVILYGILGSEVQRRSKCTGVRAELYLEGTPSTDEGAFQMAINSLEKSDPLHDDKLECLQLLMRTIKSITRENLFWKAYPNWKHLDGKLRPMFKLMSTKTRRPTGSAPNFLQLPQGSLVRGNVCAPKGYILIAPDWSAEEMRLIAWESQCPDMLSGYIGEHKKDLHSITGSVIAPYMYKNLCPSLLNKVKYVMRGEIKCQDYDQYMEWRSMDKSTDESKYSNIIRKKRSKNLNFLSMFSGTAYSAREQLLIPLAEAEILVDMQRRSFSGLGKWQKKVLVDLNKKGYMHDAFGQRYHYRKQTRKGYAMRELRQTLNNYAQGCATAILHEAGRRFNSRKLYDRFGAYIMAPIYDELLCCIKIDTPERMYECLSEIRYCMKITPPGHGISQIPEFEIYIKGADGKSRWAENGVDLDVDFTLDDIKKLEIKNERSN
jgi:DNA polymerase I-like protein with 3'-5' exonuclease and polymerase domains